MAELEEVFQDATTNNPQGSSSFFLLICFTLTLALLVLLHFATARRRASHERLRRRLPPSPPALPVIGHMHHLAGPLPPHVCLRDLAERHGAAGDGGGLMLLRLGQVPNLIASSPRAAEAILHTHDRAFASRPRSALTDVVFGGATDVGFAPYGGYWRTARMLVTAHMLSARKVLSFRRAREEEARRVVAKVHAASAGAGAVLDMSEVLRSFETDLVCRAVSGEFFRDDGARNELFRELIDETVALCGGFHLEDHFPSITKVPLLARAVRSGKKLKERWDELFDELIDDRTSKLEASHSHASSSNQLQEEDKDQRDLVDALLFLQQEYGLTRTNIKAILLDIFIAGSDTSYMVLEFAMVELIRNPHILTKLQAEVRTKMSKGKEMVTEDDLTNMVYLKAVIKETLRLHPPGPLLAPHFSTTKCGVLDEYKIPNGTRVIVNVWAIARDHRSWERADEFVPERFMDGGKAATIDFKGRDFQFLPFGSGRRMCPGMNFGMASVEIMLANLVYCFNWELPPGMKEKDIDMTDVFGVVVRRKEKLFLIPRPHYHNVNSVE